MQMKHVLNGHYISSVYSFQTVKNKIQFYLYLSIPSADD